MRVDDVSPRTLRSPRVQGPPVTTIPHARAMGRGSALGGIGTVVLRVQREVSFGADPRSLGVNKIAITPRTPPPTLL